MEKGDRARRRGFLESGSLGRAENDFQAGGEVCCVTFTVADDTDLGNSNALNAGDHSAKAHVKSYAPAAPDDEGKKADDLPDSGQKKVEHGWYVEGSGS